MEKLRKLYSLLESLAMKNSEELTNSYSKKNIEAICLLSKELLDQEIFPQEITKDVYIKMVKKLRELMIQWSKKLGEAIIAADDQFKKNNIEGTIKILEGFSCNCSAFYYKSIAQAQVMKYKKRIAL